MGEPGTIIINCLPTGEAYTNKEKSHRIVLILQKIYLNKCYNVALYVRVKRNDEIVCLKNRRDVAHCNIPTRRRTRAQTRSFSKLLYFHHAGRRVSYVALDVGSDVASVVGV